MWHIYLNGQGLYEFAYVSKGRYIAGSRQGYAHKKNMCKIMHNMIFNSIKDLAANIVIVKEGVRFDVQDDSMDEPLMARVSHGGTLHWTGQKPGKAYTHDDYYLIPDNIKPNSKSKGSTVAR